METTWIGQTKVVVFRNRYYKDIEVVRDAVTEGEWAYAALKKPNEIFPSGKQLHECANRIIEKIEDALLDYRLFTV